MKHYGKWLIVLACMAMPAAAQQVKIGYFNSDAVMKQLPDAQDAQKQLDQLVADWQQEINKMQDDWKHKFDDYDKRKLIMTDQRRAEAERELRDLDQKIVDYRNQKFGQNGELFNKQNELMKPVQDRVFKAVQDVAKEDSYDYIFDKSSDVLLMYTNEKYDVTLKVADKLKIVMPETTTSPVRSTPPTSPATPPPTGK
ncbi:MAG TPA: OmpH family outer membrane protein [Bacteroidota bacterium]|nr:OmpH family outer membrane protein [Bacteroidota bacterium]